MARRVFPKFRFSVKNLLVLVLGIAIGFALNAWTLQMRLGRVRPVASTPGYIIDCIPPYQRPISTVLGNGSLPVECEPSPEARERVRALIAPLAEKLGVKL